jgi:hypothetical protein
MSPAYVENYRARWLLERQQRLAAGQRPIRYLLGDESLERSGPETFGRARYAAQQLAGDNPTLRGEHDMTEEIQTRKQLAVANGYMRMYRETYGKECGWDEAKNYALGRYEKIAGFQIATGSLPRTQALERRAAQLRQEIKAARDWDTKKRLIQELNDLPFGGDRAVAPKITQDTDWHKSSFEPEAPETREDLFERLDIEPAQATPWIRPALEDASGGLKTVSFEESRKIREYCKRTGCTPAEAAQRLGFELQPLTGHRKPA